MSAKNRFKNKMRAANARAGGSHMTRQARNYFIEVFVRAIYSLGFPLQQIAEIGVRAVKAFVQSRGAKSLRTRQNDMAALRTILRASGREQFARDQSISNKALGISGASRRGTKKPLSDDVFSLLLSKISDAGLQAILLLERALGLRAKEAILCVRSLESWRKALLAGKRELYVIFGTKGSRPRWVGIVDLDAALSAVEAALGVVQVRGKLAPKSNLKSALRWYSNATNRLGIQGHSLRYAFTVAAIRKLLDDGFSRAEALAIVATWLGHGDGRGRMVRSVYAQGVSLEQ